MENDPSPLAFQAPPSHIEIEESSPCGRSLRSRKGYLKGDKVFCEIPAVSVACADTTTRHCSFCQRSLLSVTEAGLPAFLNKRGDLWPVSEQEIRECTDCGTAFCSAACYRSACDTFHGIECKALPVLTAARKWLSENKPHGYNFSNAILLCLRMAAIVLQAREAGKSTEEVARTTANPLVPAEDSALPFGGYSQEAAPLYLERLRHYTNVIQDVLDAYAKATRIDDPGLLQVTGPTLLSLLRRALCNAVSFANSPKHVFFQSMKAEIASRPPSAINELTSLAGSERDETVGIVEGVGLYPLASLINHACRPNVGVNAVVTPDHSITVVCVRHMRPNSVLGLSYLALNPSVPQNPYLLCTPPNSLAQRRHRLKSRWGFECKCTECMQEMCVASFVVEWILDNATPSLAKECAVLANLGPLDSQVEERYDKRYDELAGALEDGETDKAIAGLEELGGREYQPALHLLGCIHSFDEYQRRDAAKAAEYLCKAAVMRKGLEVNAPTTWATLADLVIEGGSGLPKEGAILLYRAAAKQGNGGAQLSLALLLDSGFCKEVGAATNAWLWCEAAANQGYIQAMYQLGIWAKEGKGVWDGEPNMVAAKLWLGRAADGGYPGAKEAVASLPDRGGSALMGAS